jgi:signal transduction histidine kinase
VLERYLRDGCEGGKLVAVPLGGANRPIGSLVVVRTPEARDFDDDEADRLRVFADLAALEFRRITLLVESEHRRRELERVTESRARLMRGFYHDVKNSLGAADGYAQLLIDGVVGELTDQQVFSLRHLRAAIGGALKLTEDLLSLARAEKGHIPVEWKIINARAVAASAIEAYQPQAASKAITITLDDGPDLPPIRSDPSRVRQVLGNLLRMRWSTRVRGGTSAWWRVGDAGELRRGNWISITVFDDGPGIPLEKQSSVFEEFVRLAPGDNAGSVLGLPIGRHVARALQGDLTLQSAVGSGSEFTLWLPLPDP